MYSFQNLLLTPLLMSVLALRMWRHRIRQLTALCRCTSSHRGRQSRGSGATWTSQARPL